MGDVLEILSVFLLSAVKFGIGGVPAAVIAEFSFFKAMIVTISGGMTGVFVFTYMSGWINKQLLKLKKKSNKPKKKFTLTNKTIVYVKRYFGLLGLAIITPLILSIPLGVFLAVRYYEDKGKIIRYMIVSVVFWAIALYNLLHTFKNLL